MITREHIKPLRSQILNDPEFKVTDQGDQFDTEVWTTYSNGSVAVTFWTAAYIDCNAVRIRFKDSELYIDIEYGKDARNNIKLLNGDTFICPKF